MATDTTLEIYRGDTVTWTCTFTLNGSALNVTGGHLWFTAKENKDDTDATAVIQKDHEIGVTNPSDTPATGIVYFSLSPLLTAVDVGTYYYDFQYVDANDNVTTLGEGKLKVLQDITITT